MGLKKASAWEPDFGHVLEKLRRSFGILKNLAKKVRHL